MRSEKGLSFIGAGRMAEAVIAGITRKKLFPANKIFVSDKDPERTAHAVSLYRVNKVDDNIKAVKISGTVILCVKPQVMGQVLDQIGEYVSSKQLVISIAAGISLQYLEKKLPGAAVVRVMPNSPCLIGEGMSVISRGARASEQDVKEVQRIFGALGTTSVMQEKDLDAVTALSGSGPAYVYRAIEGLVEGGIKAGLGRKDAEMLAGRTVLGSVRTFIETGRTPTELCDMVTSPGGTTVEGLKVLDGAKFTETLSDAVAAAKKRAEELRAEFERI